MTERRVIPMKKEAKKTHEKEPPLISEVKEAEKSTHAFEVTAAVLNVRREPDTKSRITAQVRRGQVLIVDEEKDGWGRLRSGAGWISLEYAERKCAV